MSGWYDVQFIERKIGNRQPGQRNMGKVRRIECPTEKADAPLDRCGLRAPGVGKCRQAAQTQSRLTRKSEYSRASGEPCSIGR